MKTEFWESLWMIFIILVLVYLLSGCAIFQKKPIPIPPKTGSEIEAGLEIDKGVEIQGSQDLIEDGLIGAIL